MRKALAVALLALSQPGCSSFLTDAATRVAYDLEAGAKRLRNSTGSSLAVEHVPQTTPEGCPGPYTLQLSQASSLLVWCQPAIGAPSSASYTTTYHLNYVTVPQTRIIHKDAGLTVVIDLTKQGDTVVVTGLR